MSELAPYFLKPALVILGIMTPVVLILFGITAVAHVFALVEKIVDNYRCHGEVIDLRKECNEFKWKIVDLEKELKKWKEQKIS